MRGGGELRPASSPARRHPGAALPRLSAAALPPRGRVLPGVPVPASPRARRGRLGAASPRFGEPRGPRCGPARSGGAGRETAAKPRGGRPENAPQASAGARGSSQLSRSVAVGSGGSSLIFFFSPLPALFLSLPPSLSPLSIPSHPVSPERNLEKHS